MAAERVRAVAAEAGVLARVPPSAALGLRSLVRRSLETEWERGRVALWLPVAFGAGILLYDAAPNTPAVWAGPAAAMALIVVAFAVRRSLAGIVFGSAAAAITLGFSAGTLAEWRQRDDPVLVRPLRAEARGVVESIEPRVKDRRLYLSVVALGDLAPRATPRRARVIVPKEPPLAPGDTITLTATWRPPSGPLLPGGYDFARVAFADGIGAFGSRAVDLKRAPPLPQGWRLRWSSAVERLRLDLTERIARSAGAAAEGSIAAALVTGVRTAIPAETEDEMRAAGLSHVLSISGMHLALVAGVLFVGTRGLLALVPSLALRRPIKSWAALVALSGSAFYLVLSGAEVATQRSFLMTAIVLLAVAVGRSALTARNVALAALLVLAMAPQSLWGASFQMSFAAVLAIVAGFEGGRLAFSAPDRDGGWSSAVLRWLARGFLAMLATTLLAGLATAPFAAYHFHRLTPYSLLGNLLALPIVSFWIMPSAVVGALLVPFGLDGSIWQLMGAGVETMVGVARFVAGLPGSERTLPAFGAPVLLCFTVALLAATLFVSPLRWLAVPVAGVGLALAAFEERPAVYVDQAGRAVAVRGADGRLQVAGARFASLATRSFLEADGDDPKRRTRAGPSVRCDEAGCTVPLADGRLVALVWEISAFEEDCRRAALVVTRLDAPPGCARHAAVVDRRMLAVTGSLALFAAGDGFRLEAARPPSADRAWFGRSEEARAAAGRMSTVIAKLPARPTAAAADEEPAVEEEGADEGGDDPAAPDQ